MGNTDFDFDFTIPGERIAEFKELLRVGVDAAGEGEENLVELGEDLLRQLA
jgi:hypothetical protein